MQTGIRSTEESSPRLVGLRWSRRFVGLSALLAALAPSLKAQTLTVPEVTQIRDVTKPITAVRIVSGTLIAVSEEGGIYFSRDGRSWQRRFQAPRPIGDVVAAADKFVLVLPDTQRGSALVQKQPTWISADGLKWTELHGPAVRGVHAIGGQFVVPSVRFEGDRSIEQLLVSRDAETWETHETLPPELARWSGNLGRGYLFGGRVYRAFGSQVRSSADLQTWTDEFELPPPASPTAERELAPIFASSADTLIAATMVALGEGTVHVYRKHRDAAWQRITPDRSWTFVNAIQTVGGMFVATAYRDKLRVSMDGVRWKVVADMSGYWPAFAVDFNRLVFGGSAGKIALLDIGRGWSDFGGIPAPTYNTGPKWETEHRGPSADELFGQMETVYRVTRDPSGMEETLQQALALAETASSGTKLKLAEILLTGSFGIPKDEPRGLRLLIAASDSGNAQAKLAYAQALIAGNFGATKDPSKATALVSGVVRGVDTAPREVKFQVATLYARGGMFGVARDLPRAIALMSAAADEGLLAAQFEVGRALLSGAPGVPADPTRAVRYLSLASGNGAPQASALLGQAYEQGVGVTRDLREAAQWYQKAVTQGMKEAAAALQRVQAQAQANGPSTAMPASVKK